MDKKYLVVASALTAMAVLAAVLFATWNTNGNLNTGSAVVYSYRVLNTYPHDTSAFTEGLVFSNGSLFESTGEFGASSLRRVDLQTGDVLQGYYLSGDYFGEGLTAINDALIQLTWFNGVGFVYNQNTLGLQRNFSISGEGWGLTYDGANLVMSNGSSILTFLSPQTYEIVGQVNVKAGNAFVTSINELEYINGTIYANIWHSMKIAMINPQTGQVTGWIDLTGIYEANDYDSVLNGIAYDSRTGRLFVTGKNWPSIYEITIEPAD
jgi:glutamine cyclotransferase